MREYPVEAVRAAFDRHLPRDITLTADDRDLVRSALRTHLARLDADGVTAARARDLLLRLAP